MKYFALFSAILIFAALACTPGKHSTGPVPMKPVKPTPVPGKHEPMDTIRWAPNNGRPPIKNEPSRPGDKPLPGSGDTYQIGYLLPFLTNQAADGTVPEKSRYGLQFYTGARIALEEISAQANLNLVVDVWDTQSSDVDFQSVLNTATRIQKPSVFIGPVRSSHVPVFAEWAKARHKIVVSPEATNPDQTSENPDFVQLNPTLRAHCEAITQYIRKTNRPDAVTLVCRQKEADRLKYFQNANKSIDNGLPLAELILPDDAVNFDKTDLKKYLKAGRTTVFVLPSWSSQDFVMAFLRKLKEVKGANRVEVYGMPQWRNFDSIEPEYLLSMNVHISSASWVDYSDQRVKDFQQKFYDTAGTIPDDDGFNGYDATMFTARMLGKYGLSWANYLDKEPFSGLSRNFAFAGVYSDGLDAGSSTPDYWENKSVYILKFGKSGFEPAVK